jgi:hypothetical protein
VPRWFEKTPGQTVEQDWTRLIENIGGACVDVLGHAGRFRLRALGLASTRGV